MPFTPKYRLANLEKIHAQGRAAQARIKAKDPEAYRSKDAKRKRIWLEDFGDGLILVGRVELNGKTHSFTFMRRS